MGRFSISSIVAACMLAGTMIAAEARGPWMNLGSATQAPKAFYSFCGAHPGECSKRNSRAGNSMKMTPERWAELNSVNRTVNRSVREVSDFMIYGRKDVWQVPAGKGDCEDFALLKRQRLIDLGWPSSALLMTVVRDRQLDGHAVLTVVTDKGDYVLDNRTGRISLWSGTPYIYFSRQSQSNPKAWVTVTTDVQRLRAEARH